MIFSSFEFILFFLPLVTAGYFLIGKINYRLAILWLTFASLIFYGWWNPAYLSLILFLLCINFIFASYIAHLRDLKPRYATITLWLGLIFNISVLAYFKYYNFIIDNANLLGYSNFSSAEIILPLGISFFTFQKIAYLVDVRTTRAPAYNPLDFSLFVTFFPQLIAGPIVHHKEMMPQFSRAENRYWNWDNAAAGLFIFTLGLFKKVVVADSLAEFSTWGFDISSSLSMVEAWLTALSYTFQIYFDFSGYTDMAIGCALLFNIKIPQNFNSPYKAINIQDFWRRWHMTLSRFLRDYLYIPLGGNRTGEARMIFAILATFLLGGLWHGAAWTYVMWGGVHGAALITLHLWKKLNIKMHKVAAWAITFLFVNIAWVFFRAENMDAVKKIIRGLFDFQNFSISDQSAFDPPYTLSLCMAGLIIFCATAPNSNQILAEFKPKLIWLIMAISLATTAVFRIGGYSEFLYFQF